MARIIEDKLLFIHVAKTGGTFVREIISRIGLCNYENGVLDDHMHDSFQDCINQSPEYKNLVSFGFVRMPADWIESRWRWAMATHFYDKMKYVPKAKEHWMADLFDLDINKFAQNILTNKPRIPSEYFTQMLSLNSPDDPVQYPVTHVCVYEDLISELDRIFSMHLNWKFNLHKIPSFKEKDVRNKFTQHITPSLQDEINFCNRWIIDRYYA